MPLIKGRRTIGHGIEKRKLQGALSGGRREIFSDIKKDFDRVAETRDTGYIVLDTANPSGNIIALNLQRIAEL